MTKLVNPETVSIERLREFVKAAELLADNELDMIFPLSEYSTYARVILADVMELLERREMLEYRRQFTEEFRGAPDLTA